MGEVVAPVGLRGEVKVRLLTDFPARLAELPRVCLVWGDGRERVLRLERVRLQKDFAFFRLEGIETRDEAEGLRGCEVRINRDMCQRLAEGQYYLFEVVGLEAVTAGGKSLGKVREVLRTGSNDVYATERFLIPATHDAVASIDVEAGTMLVRGEEQVVEI